MDDVRNKIEAILFACGRKISLEEIQSLIGELPLEVLKEKLVELKENYRERNSPLMVVEENELWKLTTRERYLGVVQKINPHTELSKTIMETLAVIAWKQPITQSEVINIRTNKAYEHIVELEKLGFINKERYARTYMIKLSQKFYDYFDLSGAQEARELFKGIKVDEELQKKMDEFKAQELARDEEAQAEDSQEDIYEKEQRESAVENAEVEPQEAAFVESYEQDQEQSMQHPAQPQEEGDAQKELEDDDTSENDSQPDESSDHKSQEQKEQESDSSDEEESSEPTH